MSSSRGASIAMLFMRVPRESLARAALLSPSVLCSTRVESVIRAWIPIRAASHQNWKKSRE